ncbi:MAG: hypothetical protein JWM80_4567 [Cyanobacteria bacterium RYN_339]|nr:hypothetical protein [Cyanobacteria bacterium RYN_339]
MSYEKERLRILEMVSKGELTPEEGQLRIAMGKVKAQRQEPAVFTPEEPAARKAPGLGPLLALLALPVVLVLGFVMTGLTLLLAFPVYMGVWLWNAQVVPAFAGTPPLAYLPTLALVVLLMLLSGALRWRRSLRVSFMGVRRGEQ